MIFDNRITAGNIIELAGIVCTLLAMLYQFVKRFNTLESKLTSHAEKLDEYGNRLERHEEGMFQIVGDVQRIIGRLELPERRVRPREQ